MRYRNITFIGAATLSVTLLSGACSGSAGTGISGALTGDTIYAPRHASGFVITGSEGRRSTLITCTNPWQGAEGVVSQLYIARDDEDVPADFSGQVLRDNAKSIVCMSSTQIAMLDAVGAVNTVSGVSGIDFISNPSIAARRGSVADVGYDGVINYELLASINPDIVLLYGVNGASVMEPKLRELGIPYVYVGDYLEESPVGKAEWTVMLGELTGRRDSAEEFFRHIPERYDSLCRIVSENVIESPSVMLNTPYADTWYMPSADSYMARLIRDAGGAYVYEDSTGTTSRPIDMERAYMLASQADMWLNPGRARTLAEVRESCPRFTDIRAMRNGDVYNNNLRATPGGGNDFYESAIVHPDLVLRDLIRIFHPELVSDDLIYYQQLN